MEKRNDIWVEKWRPKTFDDVVGQDDIVKAIRSRLDNLPHLIFEGLSGTGKTTVVKIIARELDADFLELNSSNERGIEVVRSKILNFCKHLSISNAPYKILFLDESDSMTNESQLALRPMMEHYSYNCRFVFGCNYVDKIIRPIRSRCKEYKFRPIDKNSMVRRLKFIAEREKLFVSMSEKDIEEALGQISERSRGDLRRAINDLQMDGLRINSETEQMFNY